MRLTRSTTTSSLRGSPISSGAACRTTSCSGWPEQKRLRDPAVLEAQVQRMLKDPKAAALVKNFGEQWLNLRLMDRKKPDAAKFPFVDDELLDAMRQETLLFVGAIFREDRSILDFIDGRFTFVNGPLARYYGIPGVDGEAVPARRARRRAAQRHRHAGRRSSRISSYATRTSPVIRGKWVLENLLGAAPPPPPDDIPPLEEKDLGTAASMRQRLEQHRAESALRGLPQPDGSDRLRPRELRRGRRVARPRTATSTSTRLGHAAGRPLVHRRRRA